MNKFLTTGAIAVVGGCLWAQTQQGEPRTLNARTWKGTLVESGCRSSESERNKTGGDSSPYPASTRTTSFGLMTADGKCILFDVSSNEKVAGMFKINDDWDENTVNIKATKVEVVGTEQGGKISIDEIEIR